MPISPKYTWSETEATVEVHVELPGVSKSNANIFATDALLKVNRSPYLLLIDLHKDVDDSQIIATIDATGVTFKLVKVRRLGKNNGTWLASAYVSCSMLSETLSRKRRAARQLNELLIYCGR